MKFCRDLIKQSKTGYRSFLERLKDDELVDIKNYPEKFENRNKNNGYRQTWVRFLDGKLRIIPLYVAVALVKKGEILKCDIDDIVDGVIHDMSKRPRLVSQPCMNLNDI